MAVPDDRHLIPIVFKGSRPGVEEQDVILKVSAKTVEGSKAYLAELSYRDGHTENCIAVCRKRSHASEIFMILNSCSHQNIAKPIGLWEDSSRMGYIVFQNFDGVLSTLSKEIIFETETLSGQKTDLYGFTEAGHTIFSDTVSAVKYMNDHYRQLTTQKDNRIPLRSLRIEKDTVFYQHNGDREYRVLLSDFQTGGSGEDDVHKVECRNWNNLGKFTGQLYEGEGWSAKSEVTHLIDVLQDKAVKYEDIIWEAGLWDLNTKLHFLREIYWCYDTDEKRKEELEARLPLGLQTCIDTLEVNKTRSANRQITDTDLFTSVFFLRVFILAHQDNAWEVYSGPKVDIIDKKAVERFVLRHKDDYMVKLIRQIRILKWLATSPYLQRANDYMSVHYHTSK